MHNKKTQQKNGDKLTEYIIKTNKLTKKYSKNIAVNSINMNIEKGKIYALLGKNGAGKTTTMCMLLNLTHPTSGQIQIFNKNPKKHPKEIYSKIGSIIETPGFYENLTAYENLKIISKLRKQYNPKNIQIALKIVNLENEKTKKFKNYSLGMKQRLGLAAATMHNPKLLILDEPTNGLDPIGIKEIRTLLQKLSKKYGITILISSHILSEIENIADTIGVMDEGTLIEEFSKEELHKKLNKYVEFEVSDINLAVKTLKKAKLKENTDFTYTKQKSKKEYSNTNKTIKGKIHLYSNLEQRDKINTQFIKTGISVKKLNLHEENLEDFFTRIVSNN